MKHYHWTVLTSKNETIEGTDDMPNPGVRDAAAMMRLDMKGYPVSQLVCLPVGADLIFFRSVEIPKDTATGRVLGRIVTYHLGWNLGGKKTVCEFGFSANKVKWWRRVFMREKPEVKPFATMKDFDGKKE